MGALRNKTKAAPLRAPKAPRSTAQRLAGIELAKAAISITLPSRRTGDAAAMRAATAVLAALLCFSPLAAHAANPGEPGHSD